MLANNIISILIVNFVYILLLRVVLRSVKFVSCSRSVNLSLIFSEYLSVNMLTFLFVLFFFVFSGFAVVVAIFVAASLESFNSDWLAFFVFCCFLPFALGRLITESKLKKILFFIFAFHSQKTKK